MSKKYIPEVVERTSPSPLAELYKDPDFMRLYRAELEKDVARLEKISGRFKVTVDDNYDVVLNMDRDRGHVVFSVHQARLLAQALLLQARAAEILIETKTPTSWDDPPPAA